MMECKDFQSIMEKDNMSEEFPKPCECSEVHIKSEENKSFFINEEEREKSNFAHKIVASDNEYDFANLPRVKDEPIDSTLNCIKVSCEMECTNSEIIMTYTKDEIENNYSFIGSENMVNNCGNNETWEEQKIFFPPIDVKCEGVNFNGNGYFSDHIPPCVKEEIDIKDQKVLNHLLETEQDSKSVLQQDERLEIYNKKIHTGECNTIETQLCCDVCKEKFAQELSLHIHMKIHSNEKPFCCNVCMKTFKQQFSLKDHMRIHAGKMPHVCNICMEAFATSSKFNYHMKIHTGGKPHICSVCMKAFAKRYALNEHMLLHTGEKPHICSVCMKAFATRSKFNYHMKIHTGEKPQKPHICTVCMKAFRNKMWLKEHAKRWHGIKPNVCNICMKRFAAESSLNEHMKLHTGEAALLIFQVETT